MPILDSESVVSQTLAALAYSSIDMKRKLLAHTVLQTFGTHMSLLFKQWLRIYIP